MILCETLLVHGTYVCTCISKRILICVVFSREIYLSEPRFLFLCYLQDAYGGYEFEARLNFKVHSALSSLR